MLGGRNQKGEEQRMNFSLESSTAGLSRRRMAFQGPERMCRQAGGHSAGVTLRGKPRGGM